MTHNQKVEIHHIIDETSKEIYHFQHNNLNTWNYVGIYFSHRNDENDVWGDEWLEHFESLKIQRLDEFAKSVGYFNYLDMNYTCDFDFETEEKLKELENMFNPVVNKTINGDTYYSGINWGSVGTTSEKYPPILTITEIKDQILKQISKFNFEL